MNKQDLEQGCKYEIKTKTEEYSGVFVKQDDKFLYIKLKSGYNIGISQNSVITIKKIEDKRIEKTKQEQRPLTNKNLPKITILHTGGTISSKVDYSTGAVIAQFTEKDILNLFPELTNIANIDSKLVRNMQSEMMRFAHYNLLAKSIKDEADKGADGIIITQGTDMLHYTSVAMSFILENLGIPILVVGSQRSSDRPSSDAAINLISAVNFIANTDFSGVGVCMHDTDNDTTTQILPGCKIRKMHTSRRDAFKPINSKPIAQINTTKNEIKFLSDYSKKNKNKKITLKLFKEDLKIGIIKPHISMFAEEILAYKNFDGVILELLGIGHMPTMKVDEYTDENIKIYEAIKTLCKKMPVGIAPTTIYGRLNLNVYSPGKQLLDAGVIGNYTDMTPETAFIKLAWLISNYKKEEIKELFEKNLRGEISERIENEN